MKRSALVKSAGKISRVSDASLKEYVDKIDLLAVKLNQIMLKREDILELIGGEENIAMMKDDIYNHTRFIISILQTPDPEALVDKLLWIFRAHMSRGFKSVYWSAQINTRIELLKENISEKSFFELLSIYNWFSNNIPNFTIAADRDLEKPRYMYD